MMKDIFSVVILAGGLATRLRPLTETIPKALVEVNAQPFIAHQLKLLRKQGVKKVVLCLGYLGEQVVDFLGDGTDYDLSISYAFDGPALLGTAGSIKNAFPLLDENFFVLYGDSYLPCNFLAVQHHFLTSQKPALMTVFKNLSQWDNSNVEFLDGNILAYDKINRTSSMHYIDYGLGIFKKEVFEEIALQAPSDLGALYQDLLVKNQLAAFEVQERFYEVGSFTGIEELADHLATLEE